MSNGDYTVLGDSKNPVHVWWDQSTESVTITCNDPSLTDETGEKLGLRVTFNGNPKSADYNPGNFNRLARYLKAAGKSSPEFVPIKQRHLARRPQVIAELAAEAATPIGKAAKPEAMGWAMCPTCTAIVVDLTKHRSATFC
ncbi:hypothetical protein AD006_25320 [Pseudonocardia sp. EC080610-09]|uniref:hypothetical protein n=1 Tax=unclassified Pseudonocardia TaxID=2619320 RepID=UPI0006CB0C2B|nr:MULTISPECIES: hypothetical protein [unclassified Pseudonocardia]ALE74387.1 hypothetical protein FRP1_17875 [Pseudonocardia sp. EC080625-04]ALL77796.1 hypothetical protein AD006_25320 [Pseudonocardia sp. EC080610-09]ALL80712.1 hypothetical protein AD017_04910 [Pseudonocardia sp. EC080619-01]